MIPAAAVLALALLVPVATAEEGLDLMRQITSQWVKPNIMLVIDRSGSMSWPVETSSTSYSFRYSTWGGSYDGDPQVGYDYTQRNSRGPFYRSSSRSYPNAGIGHGYWLRYDRIIDWSKLTVSLQGTAMTGTISSSRAYRVRLPSGHGLERYDLVQIDGFPGVGAVDGLYEVETVGYHNTDGDYVYLRRLRDDGIRAASRFSFPTLGASFTIQRVRIGAADVSQMEPREAARSGRYDATYRSYLYVQGAPAWYPGDLVRVSGMPLSSDDGVYLIQSTLRASSLHPGYSYFVVSGVDAAGTWDWNDPDASMSSSRDGAITLQRVMPAAKTMPGGGIWYFVPPSRMVITKNVLGGHLWIYEPSDTAIPAGSDDEGVTYYTFTGGSGPDAGSGAFYDWYRKAWVGWDEAQPSNEPIPDHNLTDAREPSDLVRELGDVVNWGLISFSGACEQQELRVDVDPDEDNQAASIDAIEVFLDTVAAGGLQPNGYTPTRAALERARQALLTGWSDDNGSYHQSTWDRDQRRSCDRTYGVILMTDGLSNRCNPNDGEWSRCPSSWQDYPAGISSLLWEGEDDQGIFLTNIRTWVIGVSPGVGRCELNYTAYRGRTDASSPNDDAGFDTEDDPRLPEGGPGDYDPSLDYAYFTNSAEELKDAYTKIVTSMGAGGYATGAPSVSRSGGTSGGSLAFLGSTSYPSWEGHLQAFDLSKGPDDDDYLVWDAAAVLGDPDNPNAGVERRIYTWDPEPSGSNNLVEMTASELELLDEICGGCGFTAPVLDFVRGNDGQGNRRSLQLGPIINSTPTVIGRPQLWFQNTAHEHSSFESRYLSRHNLVWVGTSDGTVRAFDVVDGAEIICLIPPDLLDHQVQLYQTYLANPKEHPLGQEQLPSRHHYGVANSLRFTDVFFDSIDTYRTVIFITEGPGGSGLYAIDVTHPYPGRTIGDDSWPEDPDFGYGLGDFGDPVKVLWSITGDGEAETQTLSGLGNTWSVPAVAPVAFEEWWLQIGAGVNSDFHGPRVFFLDPTSGEPATGNASRSRPLLGSAPVYWVSNRAFADSVLWRNSSAGFHPDNIANEGVQVDLHGHLWRLVQEGNSIEAELVITLVDPEPFYYSPAVAGYPELPSEHSVYTFASGSYFETNPAITGEDVGLIGHFTPKLYVATRELDTGDVELMSIVTGDLPHPDGGTLGRRTQPTASPLLFIPSSTSNELPFALYLLYDPDATTCVGESYIVRIAFDPDDLTLDPEIDVHKAGEGTASGFALSGERILVAQSALGPDAEARLLMVPDLVIPTGGGGENVRWWIELQ